MSVVVSDVDTLMAYTVCNRRSGETHVNQVRNMAVTNIVDSDMLDAYIHYCMHKKSKEREVKFAKAAVDFSNELTHNRTATAMDAELCYNAVLSTVHIIRTLNKYND